MSRGLCLRVLVLVFKSGFRKGSPFRGLKGPFNWAHYTALSSRSALVQRQTWGKNILGAFLACCICRALMYQAQAAWHCAYVMVLSMSCFVLSVCGGPQVIDLTSSGSWALWIYMTMAQVYKAIITGLCFTSVFICISNSAPNAKKVSHSCCSAMIDEAVTLIKHEVWSTLCCVTTLDHCTAQHLEN